MPYPAFYARKIYLKFVPMRIRQALAMGLVTLAPALTGCLTHIRAVPKTRPAEVVMSATLDQLLTQVDTRFNEIQSLNASVEIVASEGGSRQGQIKEFPSFSGYIFLRKPENLRVLMRLPLLGSQALDMVSDGKSWKLWIPPKKLPMTGPSQATKPPHDRLQRGRQSYATWPREPAPQDHLRFAPGARSGPRPDRRPDPRLAHL